MALSEKIIADLTASMKAQDAPRTSTLRMVKAAMMNRKIDKGAELDDDDMLKLLRSLVKQRKDSLEIFQQQNRADLAKKEEEEIAIISKFLPKQLSAEEIKADLVKIITAVGATSPADMGKVMGAATKQFAGKADGKTISALVKELLSKS